MAGELRIGTSGYHYDDWRGRFYPVGLPKKEWFACYARHFDTLEVKASFYRLPSKATFATWAAQAPKGFVYAVKFSRFGSHHKKLLDPEGTIGLFLERAAALGPTLGPVLVQLPPRFGCNPERLDAFLSAAPKRHRWAIELRDPSWLVGPVFSLLERHGAALVIHDLIDGHPRLVTADFVYLRFHGHDYGGRYSPQALTAVARQLRAHLANGLDVYAYFNNDRAAAAIADAQNLRRYVAAARARG
jgi:uncharacterized protein YecE (DUF72 family)